VPISTAARSVPKPGDKPCEDHHGVDHARGLVAVADGLGQYAGGAEASALAVAEALAALSGEPPTSPTELRPWLGRALTCAARALHARGQAEPRLGSMATTLTLARLDLEAGRLDLVHVGDSRAYRLRDGELAQLTRDHSIAWEQVEAGALTREAARNHPNQRLLTRSIVARRDFVVGEVSHHELAPGDLLLLCTDGVTKPLTDEVLVDLLDAGGPLEALADALLAAVDQAGRVDDTTFVLVRVD
jgi:serine/threonine protein phosphatase PrpC